MKTINSPPIHSVLGPAVAWIREGASHQDNGCLRPFEELAMVKKHSYQPWQVDYCFKKQGDSLEMA